jgi:cardiolipin synthase
MTLPQPYGSDSARAKMARTPDASLRGLAEQALSRTAGAPLVPGNRVALLRDATDNFPAWLAAMERAQRSILLETYIFADDRVGNRFAAALAGAAGRGVQVRVLQDWFGARGEGRKHFGRLEHAGIEVRWFNPFRFEAPLSWLRRDHRKSLVVDGQIGFVTGLCIAARWEGDPARGIAPWRDAGVEIEGPAVADLAHAFARTWAEAGRPMQAEELPRREDIPMCGDVALRIIATEPSTTGVLRLDQFIAAAARRTLWLTDAYFIGMPSYVQALRSAAMDAVDVRLLVPGASDLGMVKRLGTSGYRPLLESGIRVFEWNGPMLHAKTAVADGRWARVGSTNLNLASWMGNWELDVAVEDAKFAREMEQSFEADLGNATEIVLGRRRRQVRIPSDGRRASPARAKEGSAVATAGAIRIGNSVSAALGGQRVLGPAESNLIVAPGLALIAVAVLGVLWPRVVFFPLVLAFGWLGLTLLIHAVKVHRNRGRRERRLAAPSASGGTSRGLPAGTRTGDEEPARSK